jgi:monoamine oxidase
VTEIGGATQKVGFAPGNYLNPGLAHSLHHRPCCIIARNWGGTGTLYADQHQRHDPFGQGVWRGAQRHRELAVDFNGHVAELMVKAANAGALDNTITRADKEKLLIAMREWGILDKSDRYTSSIRFRFARL